MARNIRTAPCGDVLEREGDRLIIRSALPIDDLEPARFRAPVLFVDDERFVLESKGGAITRPIYVLHKRAEANAYEPEGKVLVYDGMRHLEKKRERRRMALAWALWIPTVPLLPLLGLLPERWKDKLVALGVNPGVASKLSVGLEWAFIAFGLPTYFFLGGFFTPLGAVLGLVLLVTAADIAYRVTADAEGRTPGVFAVVGALWTFVRDFRKTDTTRILLAESAGRKSEGEGVKAKNEAP